jgi:serine/threonine-protein kinase
VIEAEIKPGTLINNRYQIQRLLGQGGFGRTYLASDTERFGELCVLKEFVPSSRAEYIVQKSRELFEREARVLYQINHPQIPKFLAWFTHAAGLFLVQEYIDGRTYSSLLWERQQRGELFSEAEVTQWLKDLLPVLAYLHECKIVHRDISPDNIMLPSGQSQPMLIDFGLVKQQVTQIWATSPESPGGMVQQSFVGKFGYSPPEQIRMGQCYPCSDLYALAVTALVLLTGREPTWLLAQGSLEWEWRSYVNVSDHLAQILDKMLTEKPKDRYQSAQEVLANLQLHASPGIMAMSQPLIELHIEIDEDRKNRQVAEIEETDYFQQLLKQAEQFSNNFETKSETQLKAEFPQLSTLPEEIAASRSSSNIDSGTQPEAAILPKLDPAFIDRCQQKLTHYIGSMARLILEEVLEQNPVASPQQLVEALVAEIPNPQKAQEFKKSIEIEPEIQPKPATLPKLNSAFIKRCQQELARCIGPMASCILDETLAECPEISPQQLVETLAAEIPTPQKVQEFKKRVETELKIQPKPVKVSKPKLNSAFIKRCEQELTRCIGPMASSIVDETLAKYPEISLQQLVEALVAEIPNPQKAMEFRQHLLW